MDMGLGWADEFGVMTDTRVPPPRPWSTTFSQASNQTTWSQASPPPSIRDYPTLSTGFFSTTGPSSTMPSPMAVLDAAESRSPLSSPVEDPFLFQVQESLSTHEAPSVHFQGHHETSSPPPRLGFHLRRSAEDWATAVLKAVGTSVDS